MLLLLTYPNSMHQSPASSSEGYATISFPISITSFGLLAASYLPFLYLEPSLTILTPRNGIRSSSTGRETLEESAYLVAEMSVVLDPMRRVNR